MPTTLDVVREWKRRMRTREFDDLEDIVDLEGYTEICLGLTPWTVGYDVALKNYVKNIVQPWSNVDVREEQEVAGPETVVIGGHSRAHHCNAQRSVSRHSRDRQTGRMGFHL
jgi:hypothetical protein